MNESLRYGMTEARTRVPALCLGLGLCLSHGAAGTALAQAAGAERPVPREDFLAGEALRIAIPADTGSVLKGVYPIDGSGMADLPIAGRVVVAGKDRLNIEQYLAGIWAPFLKDTHVQAIPVIRVAIMGNVKTPGYYYPSPDAVIFDAINLAGGPLLPYELEDMSHLRGGKEVNDALIGSLSKGMTLREAGILSGDEILVPITDRITLKEFIPLIGTTMAIIVNAFTIYYLTLDRDN